jgi:hypothetical protein
MFSINFVSAVAVALGGFGFPPTAFAAPIDVPNWSQFHDFSSSYVGVGSDLQQSLSSGPGAWITYDHLVDPVAGFPQAFRATTAVACNAIGGPIGAPTHQNNVADRSRLGIAWNDAAPAGYAPFTAPDYAVITSGGMHCAPTSFGMADNFWWRNSLVTDFTITRWATAIDTNDVNPGMNTGDHALHFGSLVADNGAGIASQPAPTPWGGNYMASQVVFGPAAVPANPAVYPNNTGGIYNAGNVGMYLSEIRAGRPTKTGDSDHAVLGKDWNAAGMVINDPWTGAPGVQAWPVTFDHTAMQLNKAPAMTSGNRVYFTTDGLGSGQTNVQAQGGDPGDIFQSGLDVTYARMLDDVGTGLVPGGTPANDFYGTTAHTRGDEVPFDMEDFDRLASVMRIDMFMYSLDQGDPNPFSWKPHAGVSADPTVEEQEIDLILDSHAPGAGGIPYPLWTAGQGGPGYSALTATENQLGLHYLESNIGVGRLLDDDLDGFELENTGLLTFTPDYVDSRVYPDMFDPSVIYHELAFNDPTDIYHVLPGGGALTFVDGEPTVCLKPDVDIDAVQFVSFSQLGSVQGLLFSVDNDAPSPPKDCANTGLDPGTIYFSFLNGTPPRPYMAIGGDLDAIKALPEPGTLALLSIVAAPFAVRRRRRVREER